MDRFAAYPARVTFVIDPAGLVGLVYVVAGSQIDSHASTVLEDLRILKDGMKRQASPRSPNPRDGSGWAATIWRALRTTASSIMRPLLSTMIPRPEAMARS